MSEPLPSLEAYVEQLIQAKAVPDLSEDQHDQLRDDLLGRLEERINLSILEALPPAALEAYHDLLDTIPDDEAIHNFIHGHVANVGEVIAAELVRFRQNFLGE